MTHPRSPPSAYSSGLRVPDARSTAVTCGFTPARLAGLIRPVALRMTYPMISNLVSWMTPLRRGQGHRDPLTAPPTGPTPPQDSTPPDVLGRPRVHRRYRPPTPPPPASTRS